MISLRVEEVVQATQGQLVCQGMDGGEITNIVIDSRLAGPGAMFVAIVGESTDGHVFLESAHQEGCRFFLVSNESYITDRFKDSTLVKVDNTEIGLGLIAKYYRDKFDIPFVGITGSVGKTTTRDMVYSVLASKFNTIKNEKNYNNQFGVPLTLFRLETNHQCAVIEMGMCGFGEIEYLANIVRPKIGIITNIGMSHIEHLGSQEGIFKAKMEITSGFDQTSSLIINADDSYLRTELERYRNRQKDSYKVYSFGMELQNDLCCKSQEVVDRDKTRFTCSFEDETYEFTIPCLGEHNVRNAMAAILAGHITGMTMEEISKGLLDFVATENRQDIIKTDRFTLINDVYNASPDSMIAALKVLKLYKDGRRVAILGDCLEMGQYAEEGHRRVGYQSIDKADIIITAGHAAKFIGVEAMERGFDLSRVFHFETKEELIDSLPRIVEDGDVILLKASRGMKFEDIVEVLKGGCQC